MHEELIASGGGDPKWKGIEAMRRNLEALDPET
jgi:hypothetical protein